MEAGRLLLYGVGLLRKQQEKLFEQKDTKGRRVFCLPAFCTERRACDAKRNAL